MKSRLSPAMIALVAVLIALTTVFTLLIRVPTPARGYVNLSDVAVTFASLIFGPWVGMVAGGVGTALADLLGGFAPFAPLSLVAHGLEGFLIGLIALKRRSVGWMIVAWLIGSLAMVAVYLVGEGIFYTGWPLALAEVPMNAFQALVGGLIGIPLALAVRKAYPPVDRIGQRSTWTEE
jgi:uncharacterized membrane protein